MHESSLVQSILNTVIEIFQNKCANEVTNIHITLGEYAGLNQETFEFHLNLFKNEYEFLKSAKTTITVKPGMLECHNCNFTGNAKIKDDIGHELMIKIPCPNCKSLETSISEGKNTYLERLECN